MSQSLPKQGVNLGIQKATGFVPPCFPETLVHSTAASQANHTAWSHLSPSA